MERLTVKRPDGRWAIANNDGANPREQMMKIPIAIDRLAAYEDMEEQGRLLVLPCPMGSSIYMIVTNNTKGREPFSFIKITELMESNVFRVCREYGKTVFLTRKEAERALEGQK